MLLMLRFSNFQMYFDDEMDITHLSINFMTQNISQSSVSSNSVIIRNAFIQIL